MLAMVFPSAAPALSPPQAPEKVYFSNGNRIVSINADGTGREVLTGKARAVDGLHEASGDFRPQVSPDGNRMVFLSYREPGRFNFGNSNRIRVAATDGSGAKEILAGRRNLLRQETPTWTPDGQRLVLTKEVTEGRSWISSVVSVKPDGTGMRTLVTIPRQVGKFGNLLGASLTKATMSPDGLRLLVEFSNGFKPSSNRLAVVDLETGKRRSLGRQTYSGSWSADGTSIIYVSGAGAGKEDCVSRVYECIGPGDIFVSDADGTDRQRLTRTAADEDGPSFNRAGNRVLFSSNPVMPRNFMATEIYSMKPDGTCRVALTNGAPGSFHPVWGGPGSGAQPVCGQSPPKVLTEVDLRRHGSARFAYWLSSNVDGTLLSGAFPLIFSDNLLLSYADCDLERPSACRRAFGLFSWNTCPVTGTLSALGSRDYDFVGARRGAAVFFDQSRSKSKGAVVLAGSSVIMVASGGDRNTTWRLVDRLQPVPRAGTPPRRLPPPRIPARDLRTLKKVERNVKKLGSARAAAVKLDRKRTWVVDVLRFGRRMRSLGPIRTVKCPPLDPDRAVTFREHSPGPSGR
jgi:hypothetical protein